MWHSKVVCDFLLSFSANVWLMLKELTAQDASAKCKWTTKMRITQPNQRNIPKSCRTIFVYNCFGDVFIVDCWRMRIVSVVHKFRCLVRVKNWWILLLYIELPISIRLSIWNAMIFLNSFNWIRNEHQALMSLISAGRKKCETTGATKPKCLEVWRIFGKEMLDETSHSAEQMLI